MGDLRYSPNHLTRTGASPATETRSHVQKWLCRCRERSARFQRDRRWLPLSAKAYFYGRKRRAATARDGTRTALYLRVSTADQKPDLQYDGLRAYAAGVGLDVVQDYCDVGLSGRREGRPQLNALMAAARNREIDCVLV